LVAVLLPLGALERLALLLIGFSAGDCFLVGVLALFIAAVAVILEHYLVFVVAALLVLVVVLVDR